MGDYQNQPIFNPEERIHSKEEPQEEENNEAIEINISSSGASSLQPQDI